MEELKNNETSEKKERIDPLEVITLEGWYYVKKKDS